MKVDVTCLRFFIIKMTVFTVECTLHYISVLRTALRDGRTDRQTDRQTECDAICGPLLGRRAA